MSSYAVPVREGEQRRTLWDGRRGARLCLLAFTIFYFTDVCLRASSKYFWHDEIITIYFSRFSSLSQLWGALHSGLENNPPAFHLLTRATEAVFGENLLGTRIPEIVSFWIVCLCIFYFVERRAGVAGAFLAMMLPMLSGAYFYAYEARPLVIVMALAGVALLCWDNAVGLGRPTTGPDRRWLIAFSFSLLAAFMLHCYGLLLLIPFGSVELYRTIRNRRLDWGMWLALTLPLVPTFFLYRPMLRFFRVASEGTDFALFFPANWPVAMKVYSFLFTPSLAILLLFLALLARDRDSGLGNSEIEQRIKFSWEDTLLCVVFAALPAFGVILGQIANTPYFGRYFLSALLGFCIPLGVIAGAIRRRHLRPVLVAVVAATLLLNFGRLLRHRLTGSGETLEEPSVRKALSTTVGKPLLFHPLIQNQASKGAEPIAVLDITDFLYLLQYAPQLASRLYYVSPLKRDQGLRALNGYRSWSPVKYNPALTGVQLTTQFKKFYIYSDLNQMETFYKMSRFANIEAFWANGDHYLASMQTK